MCQRLFYAQGIQDWTTYTPRRSPAEEGVRHRHAECQMLTSNVERNTEEFLGGQQACLHANTNKVPIMSQIEIEKGLNHKNISSQ